MLRDIGGVILGYLAMALFIFASFSAAYLLMGADAAFQPGTYEVSTLWILTSMVLGLIAAVIGGYVCATIARSKRAPLALAVLILVVGIAVAVSVIMGNDGSLAARTGSVSNIEAMNSARQPGWVALLNPVIGVVGVIFGARLKRRPDLD
jgi:uncharacterized membrane protein YeaQ/YmgE (transglycosylase-associated protein family)